MKLNYTATPSIISPTSFQVAEESWVTDVDDITVSWTETHALLRMDTREKAIREGLITLGWTPPPEESTSDQT